VAQPAVAGARPGVAAAGGAAGRARSGCGPREQPLPLWEGLHRERERGIERELEREKRY